MFTGIVERAEVVKVDDSQGDLRIWVRSPILDGCSVGASVSLNGVCLTVTETNGDVCRFDVSQETVSRSTFGRLHSGEPVNIERPLRVGDELGSHIVQGHVDGVGRLESIEPEGDGARARFTIPTELSRYVVEKGSITIDGVGLTVTELAGDGFSVALVPHTLAVTTFGELPAGRDVNIEVDVLAKYVERLAAGRDAPGAS